MSFPSNTLPTHRPLRAVIIGAGLMGRWHADAVRRNGHRIAAVLDPQAQAREWLAGQFGARAFESLDAVQGVPLDVAHICTPMDTHVALAEAALSAGLHVVVEKPLAATAAECARIYAAGKEANRQVMPVHQFPFQDGAAQARKWLNSIGRVVRMEGRFYSAGAALGKGSAENILADVLPHPLSLMMRFAGSLPDTWNVIRAGEGECQADAVHAGMTLSIAISMNARPTTAWFIIAGTHGTIQLDLFHGYAIREGGGVSTARKILHPFDFAARMLLTAGSNLAGRAARGETAYPGLRRLIGGFYEAIQTGGDMPLPEAEVMATVRARDVILKG